MENKKQIVVGGLVSASVLFLWWKRDYLRDDLLSLPPVCDEKHILHKACHTDACQLSTTMIFLLLTGFDSQVVDFLSSDRKVMKLDGSVKREDTVQYLVYTWTEQTGRYKTDRAHHLVYYRGYIYQSYKTNRYSWISSVKDGYPLLRVPICHEGVYRIFSQHPEELKVEHFNDWCAPSNHPIPQDSPLRLVKYYSALLKPTRSEFYLKLTNFSSP